MGGIPFNIDASQENADWLKQSSWTLRGSPVDQANQILGGGGPSQRQRSLTAFLRLPVARYMPEEVKAEIRRRGGTL